MCGIVGLYLKDPGFEQQLGALFTPMLIEMTGRGPDSAGLAIYRDPAPSGSTKITAFHPDPVFDWDRVATVVGEQCVNALGEHRQVFCDDVDQPRRYNGIE